MRTQNKKLYEEAVERNLLNAERSGAKKYKGLDVAKAKFKLGIRAVDDYWDNRVSKLL